MHKDSQLGMDFLHIHSEFDVASFSARRRERKHKANAGFSFWPNSEWFPVPGEAAGLWGLERGGTGKRAGAWPVFTFVKGVRMNFPSPCWVFVVIVVFPASSRRGLVQERSPRMFARNSRRRKFSAGGSAYPSHLYFCIDKGTPTSPWKGRFIWVGKNFGTMHSCFIRSSLHGFLEDPTWDPLPVWELWSNQKEAGWSFFAQVALAITRSEIQAAQPR